jgi:hypothetical protein
MQVSLNEMEMEVAKYFGKLRQENAELLNRTNLKRDPRSDLEIHIEGFAAELAWCKANNAYPDFNIVRDLTDVDAVDICGRHVDIKHTHYPTGKLLVLPHKTSDVDVYCLVVGKMPNYRIAGYMSAEDMRQPHRMMNLGYGQTYGAEQKDLYPSIQEAMNKKKYTAEDFRIKTG